MSKIVNLGLKKRKSEVLIFRCFYESSNSLFLNGLNLCLLEKYRYSIKIYLRIFANVSNIFGLYSSQLIILQTLLRVKQNDVK